MRPTVPLIGQPFTIDVISIPVNVLLTCRCCLEAPTLRVIASALVTCPACQRVYGAIYNPQTGQVQVQVTSPDQKDAS